MKDRNYLEKVLLGKLILDSKIYFDNHTLLTINLFKDSKHRELYKVLDNELQTTGVCDLTAFYNKSKDKYDSISLAHSCTEKAYDPYIASNLIIILLETNKKEELTNLVLNINQKLNDNDDLFDILDYAESNLQKIGNVSNDRLKHISDQMPGMIKGIEANTNNQGMTGIPSGFDSIDKFTSGWQKQDLVIIGGASSMGKTSFALNISVNAAKRGHKVVIFSYEMSVNQMLTKSIDFLLDITFITPSLKYLLNRIRQYVIAKDVEMVVVDYLQLISYNLNGRSREQEVSHVTRSLKNLAKELDVTIIGLSQLSRNVSKREGGRPNLSDLRESGEIEQAADTVIFVYRPEYYNIKVDHMGNSVEGLAEIIFAKGRNIGIGSKHLKFVDYLTKFENLPTM